MFVSYFPARLRRRRLRMQEAGKGGYGGLQQLRQQAVDGFPILAGWLRPKGDALTWQIFRALTPPVGRFRNYIEHQLTFNVP
jgi:hypothetical protein